MSRFRCKICRRVISKDQVHTLCSMSASGKILLTQICKKCSKDQDKMNHLTNSIDKKLARMDHQK